MSPAQILVICGPTATGKTALSLQLASQLSGELISVDSRQVYQHMSVVTGKDIPDSFTFHNSDLQVPGLTLGYYTDGHTNLWGYDLATPDQDFSVKLFLEFAYRVAQNIISRHKLPILVGGTGLYLKAFFKPPPTFGIPINSKLRQQLSGKSSSQLFQILQQHSPTKAQSLNTSDRHNPQRLIRAIEVAINQQPSSLSPWLTTYLQSPITYDALWIGLKFSDNHSMYNQIDQRVEQRVGLAMDQEISFLKHQNYWHHAPQRTVGYQQWTRFLSGQLTREQAIQAWKYAEHYYARRQLTWFNRQPHIHWFNVLTDNYQQQIAKQVKEWYT